MLRTISLALVVGTLAVAGCGGDDDGGGSSSGGSGGTSSGGSGGTSSGGSAGSASGGSAGSASGGSAGSASGGSAGMGSGGSAGSASGGSAGMGSGGGAGASGASAFCAGYETKCGYGTTGHYTDASDCATKFNSYSTTRQACVTQHLGFAASNTDIHCTHAAGASPCDQN